MKRIVIYFVIYISCSSNTLAYTWVVEDANKPNGIKLWVDSESKWSAFAQKLNNTSEALNKPLEVIKDVTPGSLDVIKLHNGNYIIAKNNHFGSYGQLKDTISGVIINKDVNKVLYYFSPEESDRSQIAPELTPLLDNKFSIAYMLERPSHNEKRSLCTQIFTNDGKSISKSIVVTTQDDINGQHSILGLPNGGFIVAWLQYRTQDVFYKFFDNEGKPVTQDIKALHDALRDDPGLSITKDGFIELRTENESILIKNIVN